MVTCSAASTCGAALQRAPPRTPACGKRWPGTARKEVEGAGEAGEERCRRGRRGEQQQCNACSAPRGAPVGMSEMGEIGG